MSNLGYFGSHRPTERYVAIRAALLYYFIHQLERANTKRFRNAETVEVGDYALTFEARVLDPSILQSAMAEEIFIETRLMLDPETSFSARGRVVYAQPREGQSADTYLVAVEYTEADQAEREAFFAKALQIGELIDPSAPKP